MKLNDIHSIPKILLAALQLYGFRLPIREDKEDKGRDPRMNTILLYANKVLNNGNFINWLKKLGVKGDIGQPMIGGVGAAYPIGDSHFVKFTTEKSEIDATIMNTGQDSPFAASILGVVRVVDIPLEFEVKPLFAIVTERLNTDIGTKYRKAADLVYKYLDRQDGYRQIERLVDKNANPEEIADKIFKVYQNDRTKLATPLMRKLIGEVVNMVYQIQKHTGVLLYDTHGANIAFKNRKPAMIDFGRNQIDWDHPNTFNKRATPRADVFGNSRTPK